MGITRECLEHMARLSEHDYLNFRECKVIELGAQTVHFKDDVFFSNFEKRVGLPAGTTANFYADMTGKEMHEAFGHSYVCVDFDDLKGRLQPLNWDLNTQVCPDEHRGQYDIVTNYGTTEHLLNQTNVFKLMHDLVKPEGFIINVIPMAKMNHGLVNYNPVLFQSLARYNNYKLMGLYTSFDLSYLKLQELVPFTGKMIAGHEYLHAILQKKSDSEFVNPSQIFENGRM